MTLREFLWPKLSEQSETTYYRVRVATVCNLSRVQSTVAGLDA